MYSYPATLTDLEICVDDIDLLEAEVTIEFEYEPYDPGVRYYSDGSGCPPSGDYVTVDNVTFLSGVALGEGGKEYSLSRSDVSDKLQRIEDKLYDEVINDKSLDEDMRDYMSLNEDDNE